MTPRSYSAVYRSEMFKCYYANMLDRDNELAKHQYLGFGTLAF